MTDLVMLILAQTAAQGAGIDKAIQELVDYSALGVMLLFSFYAIRTLWNNNKLLAKGNEEMKAMHESHLQSQRDFAKSFEKMAAEIGETNKLTASLNEKLLEHFLKEHTKSREKE